MIIRMQRLMRTILAVWFVIAMTLAQGCVATSPSANAYTSGATPAVSTHDPSSSSPYGGAVTTASESTTHLDTTGYTASQRESQALSDYLKQHRLPLVGAQVLHGPDAQRAVVLYGYVGSEFGKSDAAAKAKKYLNDPGVAIDNRVKVRPEILAGGSSAPGAAATTGSSSGEEASNPDNSAYPGADSYVAQQEAAQQYAQQQQSGIAVSGGIMPLAILGLMALSMASGGAFSVGSGSSGLSGGALSGGAFGPPPPYNPYPGYASPYPGYASPPPPYPSYGP